MSSDVPSAMTRSQPIAVADRLEVDGVGRRDPLYAGVDGYESTKCRIQTSGRTGLACLGPESAIGAARRLRDVSTNPLHRSVCRVVVVAGCSVAQCPTSQQRAVENT